MLEVAAMKEEKLRNQVSSRFADTEYALLTALEKELDRSESYVIRVLVVEALRARRLLGQPEEVKRGPRQEVRRRGSSG